MSFREMINSIAQTRHYARKHPASFIELRVSTDEEILGMLHANNPSEEYLVLFSNATLQNLQNNTFRWATTKVLAVMYKQVSTGDVSDGLQGLVIGKKLIIDRAGVRIEDDDPSEATIALQNSRNESSTD